MSANHEILTYDALTAQLNNAGQLINNVVLKKYLHSLNSLDIVPLDKDVEDLSNIRLFKITEMVYQKDEYSTYKFASVFDAVQSLNCGIFVIANSDGRKTEFYMGVRSHDEKHTTKSLKDTLKNALCGQFPGVKVADLLDSEAQNLLDRIPTQDIVSVSCVANNKDDDFNNNTTFIQGLEKLALAMQGQIYTAIILANSTSTSRLDEIRHAYESIYTQLSPFATMQLSYGSNTALTISQALSHSQTIGTSHSTTISESTSTTDSDSKTMGHSVSKQDIDALKQAVARALAKKSISVTAAAPFISGLLSLFSTTVTTSDSQTESHSEGKTETKADTETENKSEGTTETITQGTTTGISTTMQLSRQNKTVLNTLNRIDLQLKRIDECESLGMWECAAYFLSDSQETAEMAAGTYKALMKGENSGLETSALNFWGRRDSAKLPMLRSYLTNFIHPAFVYSSDIGKFPVTAASLVSSNELAIQMGLPRKAVCGFPVIEHADFGKEIVTYGHNVPKKKLHLGKIFSMGAELDTEVALDVDSLTMHTFVTGSTGSGKSNTIYKILEQLRANHRIPFMVIEPAKGEYKDIFGQYPDVSVYGTNPQKTALLKLNPFRFPKDIHVLEHLDRLVEIFNACWPMYAAMPAILKEAIERAYVEAGWDLITSQNQKGAQYPNFSDLFEQIRQVISESQYSADGKSDYSGALLTRVHSLTNGLNKLIFCNETDITDTELFDENVIIDLSRIGSIETKALIMGLLVMKLYEYRMALGKSNSPLSHLTVLEEAHNLLKRTSTSQISESANLLGKSVELLANSIAEMRTYGEGFLIADQSPNLLDMSVIRNTNTKIILRLPDKEDDKLVGYAAGLTDDQIDELAKLKKGVAAVYQNDWVEPILVQINKCKTVPKPYAFTPATNQLTKREVKEELLSFLLQGRIKTRLRFSPEKIKSGLHLLMLSTPLIEFIKEQLFEYEQTNKLTLWLPHNFELLSRRITDILGVRDRVSDCMLHASTDSELTHMLENIIWQSVPNASREQECMLMQCLVKDWSTQPEEETLRRRVWYKWAHQLLKGGR
ncbi:ATP-binding protein [Megasphaera stantonii]|uniref:ATP-binding protein n=1 Tax=Megasphaera stantonii TaxID=2144175 RepID=UPI0019597C2D|nr:ATP-binding protein [Megasphaera stantonii]MBM6733167.1 ATP-binding protein [Megasphaera stantonii]